MTENEFIKLYLKGMASNMRLFRINAGQAWAGTIIKRSYDNITIKNPRVFRGAPNGWPDLAGWTEIEITPDMVGQKIAVFTAREAKVTGNLSAHQKLFKKILLSMGGDFEVIKPKY
jgi:hypothetical protein